ncbi:hypothetical protein AJ79_04703 [Helicocarpus griseus UAMH5409]|uniref:Uncharacterized protein n=1 Tax=Helicocarpus griseus UAMH5409 TaxID=1447875 RepID=A0A2B7XRS7_9EURO|nr:hypothetical protein AJ79_04703 [Helicocarpus griseus UAMH5409]
MEGFPSGSLYQQYSNLEEPSRKPAAARNFSRPLAIPIYDPEESNIDIASIPQPIYVSNESNIDIANVHQAIYLPQEDDMDIANDPQTSWRPESPTYLLDANYSAYKEETLSFSSLDPLLARPYRYKGDVRRAAAKLGLEPTASCCSSPTPFEAPRSTYRTMSYAQPRELRQTTSLRAESSSSNLAPRQDSRESVAEPKNKLKRFKYRIWGIPKKSRKYDKEALLKL